MVRRHSLGAAFLHPFQGASSKPRPLGVVIYSLKRRRNPYSLQNEPLFQFRKSPHDGRRISRPVHARSAASPDLRTYHPGASKKPGRSSTGGAAGSGHPIFHKKERRPEIFRRSFQSKSLKTIQQTFQSPSVETAKALTHSQGAGSKIRSTTLRARKRNP